MLRKINLFALILFLLPLVTYILTFPREIGFVDSGLIAASSVGLGIPLPTGFPFYIILSHLFILFPLGEVIDRLYIFSILCSLLTLLVVFEIIRLLIKSKNIYGNLSAFVGAISLAFSYQFWSSSINIETVSLTLLFLNLMILLILRIGERIFEEDSGDDIKTRYLVISFGVILGLASGLNPTVIVFLPALLLWAIFLRTEIVRNIKLFFAAGLIAFVIFILLYSYLPLRAHENPFLNFGNPTSLSSTINVMTGRGFLSKSTTSGNSEEILGFTLIPQVLLQSFAHVIEMLFYEFNPLLLLFSLYGVYCLRKNLLPLFILLTVFCFNLIFSVFYITGNQENWMLEMWVVISIMGGVGLFQILNKVSAIKSLRKIFRRKEIVVAFVLLVSILPLFFWYPQIDRSRENVTRDYIKNLYINLDKNSIIIGGGNFFESQTAGAKVAENYRPDVFPLFGNDFYDFDWYRNNISKSQNLNTTGAGKLIEDYPKDKQANIISRLISDNPGRKFYIDILYVNQYLPDVYNNCNIFCNLGNYYLIPHGLLYELSKTPKLSNSESIVSELNKTQIRKPYYLELLTQQQIDLPSIDYSTANEILGQYFLSVENSPKSIYYLKKALEFGGNSPELLYKIAVAYQQTGDLANANKYFGLAGYPEIQNNKAQSNLVFSYPKNWSYYKQADKIIIQNDSKTFTIELKQIFLNNAIIPKDFASQDTQRYGVLSNQGAALIPHFDNAYVKIWNDNGVKKDQFYLFLGNRVIEVLVYPSDSPLMDTFNSILETIKPQ